MPHTSDDETVFSLLQLCQTLNVLAEIGHAGRLSRAKLWFMHLFVFKISAETLLPGKIYCFTNLKLWGAFLWRAVPVPRFEVRSWTLEQEWLLCERHCHENPAKYARNISILPKNGQESLHPYKDTCPETGMKPRSPRSQHFFCKYCWNPGTSPPIPVPVPTESRSTGVSSHQRGSSLHKGSPCGCWDGIAKRNLGRWGYLGFAFFRNLRNRKHN